MKLYINVLVKIPWKSLAFVLALFSFVSTPAYACIFVLTDTNHALFCNNEDWSNPKTRIWFLPAGEDYYGAIYVGFDDGGAQGGMNTEGLAYYWVAGYKEKWEAQLSLPGGVRAWHLVSALCARRTEQGGIRQGRGHGMENDCQAPMNASCPPGH
jgi:hypothetical protein